MSLKFPYWCLMSLSCSLHAATPLFPRFKAIEIDSHVDIGYGVTVADVDGDGKPDILLADKKQIVWYQNPTWKRFVIAENLTPLDDVCIAAADVDGSGKASIAVGAQWNPSDTVNSGAVFYLIALADRTQKWEHANCRTNLRCIACAGCAPQAGSNSWSLPCTDAEIRAARGKAFGF